MLKFLGNFFTLFFFCRSLLSELRRLEKETYLVQRALADEPGSEHLLTEMSNLEAQVILIVIFRKYFVLKLIFIT